MKAATNKMCLATVLGVLASVALSTGCFVQRRGAQPAEDWKEKMKGLDYANVIRQMGPPDRSEKNLSADGSADQTRQFVFFEQMITRFVFVYYTNHRIRYTFVLEGDRVADTIEDSVEVASGFSLLGIVPAVTFAEPVMSGTPH